MANDQAMENNDNLGLDEDERLPWLESADDYGEYDGGNGGKLLGFVLLGLLVVALVVGGYYWLQNRGGADGVDGDGSIIAAEEGDYKVAPDDPEGKEFEGTGDASYKASEGERKDGKLADAADKKSVSQSAPASAGSVLVQLGAYSSEAQANTGWSELSRRYDVVGKLPKKVVSATVDGGTVYRLSAVAPNAAVASDTCDKIKAAGGSCLIVR